MPFDIFAMPSSSIALLFSIVLSGSNALPWIEAQQTHVYEADAWSPRPTYVPRAVDPLRLFSRDSLDIQICGWLGGNSASAATCSPGSSCIRDILHGVVGCCATAGPCTAGVYTSCVDMSSSGWTPNSGIQTNGVFTCSGTALCYKNTFPGGYYQFGCGQKSWATTAETTYTGMPSNLLLQQVFTGVDFTAIAAAASTSSSTTSSTSTSPSSLSSTLPTAGKVPMQTGAATPTPTTPAATPPKNINAGTIVGSVVGGLAGLALIGVALIWCLRRRKTGRAGPFKSAHSNGPGPISGPFQRVSQYQPYGPDDFRHAGEMAAGEPSPSPYRYTDARSQPMDIHHQFYSAEPSPPHEGEPLVSEIEDFAQGYQRAIAEPPTDEGGLIQDHDMSDAVMGRGMAAGVSKLRRKPVSGTGVSNARTQDRDVTDEPLRSPAGSAIPGYHSEPWESAVNRSSPSPDRTGNGSETSLLNRSSSPILPAKSPMRDGMVNRGASLMSAVGRDTAPRYQLVDQTRDDMPVYEPLVRSRTTKMSRSVRFENDGAPRDM